MAVGQRHLRPKLPAKLVWLNIRATHFLYQTTAHYSLIMVLQNDLRIGQHLCRFCPWSHIHCVQFIVYLDHIIIIVLVPFLKHWWRSPKKHYIISNGYEERYHHTVPRYHWSYGYKYRATLWNVQCIGNGDTTVLHGVMQWKGNLRVKKMWNPFFGGTRDNKKDYDTRLHWHLRYQSHSWCDST